MRTPLDVAASTAMRILGEPDGGGVNPQPSTLHPEPCTLYPNPYTQNAAASTAMRVQTPDPKPQTS